MRADIWWKNFALGIELDSSGMFIYNGIKAFDMLEMVYHPVDAFEIMYNLSVGIERLIKVALILLEHDIDGDIRKLESSLITHNTIDLANRLDDHRNLNYGNLHKEFLSILSKFYKSQRYGRFSFSTIPDIEPEKKAFICFFQKHLNIKPENIEDNFLTVTDRTRTFLGKLIKKIIEPVFNIIQMRANELNIYTDEIRGDSKALKIFYGDKLDFISEAQAKKELLLFLMNSKEAGQHLDFIRSYEPLELDSELTPSYFKAIINDNYLPNVLDEVKESYSEIKNFQDRVNFLKIIDDEYISFDSPEEDYDE